MDLLKKLKFCNLEKKDKNNQAKENEETINLPMSHVAGQGRTDREADSVVIPKQPLFSSGSRNVEAKRKPRASGGTSVPRDDGKPKKRVKSQLKPMAGVPIEDDSDNCEEVLKIRKISEIEFRRTKEPNELKIGSSTGKEVSEDNNRGLVSPKLASYDPDQVSPNKPSSFLQKGNDDGDMDLDRDFREVSDEARFGNTETHTVSKIGSPAQQKENEGCSMATTGENVVDGNQKISFAGKEDECRNKELVSGNAILGDEDIRSDGPGPEMNNVNPGDDAQVDEDFNQESNNNKENLPKSPCSKVTGTTMPMSEGNEEGTSHGRNNIPEENTIGNTITGARIKSQKKIISPSHSKDEDCYRSDHHFHGRTEKVNEADKTEIQKGGNRGFSKHGDLFRKLADSLLEREPVRGNDESNGSPKQTTWDPNQSSLPKKFRFEDEVPKQVEKTDSEKELEEMFALHNFCMAFGDQDPFDHSKVPQEHENSNVGETEDPPCVSGKHEFEKREDTGVRCKKCLHVAVDPKDIIPDWAEKPPQDLDRGTRSRKEEDPLRFDDFHLTSSKGKCVAFDGCNGTVWNIKPGVRESMYKHQQEGFEFLWMNLAGSINLADLKSSVAPTTDVGGCIISHAPGTGKTRLTIVFIETYLKVFPKCRPVIIAPASMLLTWEEEFKKWQVDFPFYNLNNLELLVKKNETSLEHLSGSKCQNKDVTRMMKIFTWNKGGSILGISYNLFEKLTGTDVKSKDLKKILLKKPGLVVLDEGHTPRNEKSNIWNALLELKTDKRVILSGTPFQNNFAELFNTLRLVRPAVADVLEQDKAFTGMISFSSKGKKKSDAGTSQSDSNSTSITDAVKRLKSVMSPFVHVHKGTILQESLPGLRDTVVLLKPSGRQKSLIKALEGSKNTFKSEHKVALISVHPYLLKYCDRDPLETKLDTVEASMQNPNDGVKIKFILELVRLSLAMNEKVLIFSQYILPLELIKVQLSKVFSWIEGKQILQMHGKVDQKQRQILINAFNDPQNEAKVMLGTTRCCSEGISLVGASRVVLLDVVWNPSVERQAISRAYRIGQTKFVHTYHLMTHGTSEDDKYCRQVEKERLSELVFCSSSNESQKRRAAVTEDRILEAMVSHVNLKDMFERIINQPKETDLIQTFGLN